MTIPLETAEVPTGTQLTLVGNNCVKAFLFIWTLVLFIWTLVSFHSFGSVKGSALIRSASRRETGFYHGLFSSPLMNLNMYFWIALFILLCREQAVLKIVSGMFFFSPPFFNSGE